MASWSLDDVFGEIDAQAKAAGVNPRTIKALMLAENTKDGSLKNRTSFRGDAVSPVGAQGLMQVMPATAKGLQQAGFLPASWKHDPSDITSQVAAGIAAVREKQSRMNNPDDLGELASVYNGSSKTHRLYKDGKSAEMPTETINYVQKLRRANMELGGEESGAAPAGRVMSSNRSTTVSREFDPLMLDNFLTTVMGATKTGGQLDQSSDAIRAAAAKRDAFSGELVGNLIAQGKLVAEAAISESVTAAAGQAKRQSVLEGLNLDPARTGNELSKLFDAINKTDDALAPMGKDIDARMAVGFFDNPVEWLINQTRLPGMVGEYNGIVGNQKDAIERYSKLSAAASTQQALSATTDADLVLAQGVTKSRVAAAAAVTEASKVNLENAGATVRDQMILAQLTGQKAQLQGQAMQTSKESVTDSDSKSAKDQAKLEDKLTIDGVNAIITSVEGTPLTALQFKQMTTVEKDALLKASTSKRYGGTFSASFGLLQNFGDDRQLAVKQGASIVSWVNAAKADALVLLKQEKAMQLAQGNRKFNEEKEYPAMLDKVQQKYQDETVNMYAASKANPLKLDYSLVTKVPELADNSVTKWVQEYGPGGKTPMMQKVDENLLLQRFASSIEMGTMTAPQAAAEIAQFYQISTMAQASATKVYLFGMTKPKATYQVLLSRGVNDKGVNDLVDLGNATQVERALTLQVISKKASEIQNLNMHSFGLGG